MFSSILETDFTDKIKEHAESTRIKDDRCKSEYKDIYVDIENYISNNKLILSDIDILIGRKVLYKEIYNIYCDNPQLHGNNLINIMASKREKSTNAENIRYLSNPSKWLILRTSIPGRLLSILYKNKTFANIHSFGANPKYTNFTSIIKPLTYKGFYIDRNIYYMPYEIELMDIYKKLYLPYTENVKIWKDLVQVEPLLIKGADDRKHIIISDQLLIKGGNNIDRVSMSALTIKKIIIFKLLPHNDFILIGDWAVKLIEWGLEGGNFKPTPEKIQIISLIKIDETFCVIKEYMKTVIPSNPYEISYKEHNLCMPKDLRIRRYTIYTQLPCDKEGNCPVTEITLMDIFINASYELVPWISSNRFLKKKHIEYRHGSNIKIGNPYVLLRFFMLELWMLRIIYSKGLSLKNITQKKIDLIWISINRIRNPKKLGGIINKSFSLDNYMGRFCNEMTYFKEIIAEQKIPEYIPYQWKKKKQSYRTI